MRDRAVESASRFLAEVTVGMVTLKQVEVGKGLRGNRDPWVDHVLPEIHSRHTWWLGVGRVQRWHLEACVWISEGEKGKPNIAL